MTRLKASAGNPWEDRYRELLASDYTRESLNGTLGLLWTVVGQSVPKGKPDWWAVLEYNEHGKTAPNDFNQCIIERIRSFASLVPKAPLPPMPDSFSEKRPSRHAWLAERTWAYLVLQSCGIVSEEIGFFRDIQSLLFLNAAYYLLPQLEGQSQNAERNCLVHAMFMHTVIAWDDYPGQACFLRSVLMDYLGVADEKRKQAYFSFMLTPPTDHSYLTKAQTCMFDLLEAGRPDAAVEFLLTVARSSPTENIPEIQEMLAGISRTAG
jgi:hypothetical protein